MYTRKNYGFWMTVNWSKMPFFYGLAYGTLITVLYLYFKKEYGIEISLPWGPIGIIGISVAFYLGFKNNSSYDRTWEARKIWGGIVNTSRAFGAAVTAFVQGEGNEAIKRKLIYRHVAWLTALRFQLRVHKEWEHDTTRIPESILPATSDRHYENLESELRKYISQEEWEECKGKNNIATQILAIQSRELQALRDKNYFEDFRHMEFHHHITAFYEDQGKSERIKNFPFPRQYASTALWQTVLFSAFIPFGLLEVLSTYTGNGIWLNVPLSGLIIWVFFLTEKVGDHSENPFEANYNDVPITSICRSIEIDLREMIHDTDIPPAMQPVHGILM
jgi:putative membrane protein